MATQTPAAAASAGAFSSCGELGHNSRNPKGPDHPEDDTASPPAGDIATDVEGHCVRCHKSYDTTEAPEYDECVVPHVFPEDAHRVGPDEFSYDSLCCGGSVSVIEHDSGNDDFDMRGIEPCFTGEHTTDPEEVDYNGFSVRPCTHVDGQCTRQSLEDDDRKPVFWCNVHN